eukprot:Sspe_Gene.29279::Locus_13804_Transcript_2_2_Confidence_0.750_Length_703::g.29279::m.29279
MQAASLVVVVVVGALLLAGGAAGAQGVLEEHGSPTLCDATVKQYAGYFKLTEGVGTKNYFYWAFESRGNPKTDPVLLWMTGGPGCSSEVALFGENGPCHLNADGTETMRNAYS